MRCAAAPHACGRLSNPTWWLPNAGAPPWPSPMAAAYNTLVRVGRRSHVIEVKFGARSCDNAGAAGQEERRSGFYCSRWAELALMPVVCMCSDVLRNHHYHATPLGRIVPSVVALLVPSAAAADVSPLLAGLLLRPAEDVPICASRYRAGGWGPTAHVTDEEHSVKVCGNAG